MTMEIFVYLHSNDVSVEGRRNNYRFPFIISIKLNGCDDRNLTDMREKKNYGRNSFRWCLSRTFSGMKCVMIKERWRGGESGLGCHGYWIFHHNRAESRMTGSW